MDRGQVSTRLNALLKEFSLHRIARQRERLPEVFARDLMPPAAKFKFADRGVVERIAAEAVRASDRTNLFEPALRTVALRYGDGAIEGYDG